MDNYYDIKSEKLSRDIKLENDKKFVVGAASLIIVIIVNFGTCPAGLRSYTSPEAWRNSQLPRGHPRDLDSRTPRYL